MNEMHDAREFARLVPRLKADANKYTRGTVGVVGGSSAYPGAPILSSLAASRCGAGYVRLVTTRDAAIAARTHLLSIPVTGCAQAEGGTLCEASLDQAMEALGKSDVILIGPGLGTTADAERFLAGIPKDRPFVFDADALNIIARNPKILERPGAFPRILTPHEGEAARLLGRKVENRYEDSKFLAGKYDSIVVLKGPETLVASSEGNVRALRAGGPELAKAGTGDVLGGMIASFLCQGLDPLDAALLAVYVHGRAGSVAAREMSAHAVMPEDIINEIGHVLCDLEAKDFS